MTPPAGPWTIPAEPWALVITVVVTALALTAALLVFRRRRNATPTPDASCAPASTTAPESDTADDAPEGTGSGGQDLLDAELAAILDDAATELTGVPASNATLGANPTDGHLHRRSRHDPRTADPRTAPTARADGPDPEPSTAGLESASGPAPEPIRPLHLVAAPEVDIANTLAAAFNDRDVDTLAAIARQLPDHAAAAHLLAAAAAAQLSDPRGFGHLELAHRSGADPHDLPELAPFTDRITFNVTVPELALAGHLPCTRTGLALAVASNEHAVHDDHSTAEVLSAIRPTLDVADADDGIVPIFLAHTYLSLGRPEDAKRVLADDGSDETAAPHAAARLLVQSRLPHAPGEVDLDVEQALDAVENAHPAYDRDGLRVALLYQGGLASLAAGRRRRAWRLFRDVLERDPDHAGADAALRTL